MWYARHIGGHMALETQFLQEMMFAFIKSGLLTTALQLELFTHIAHGQRTVAAIAAAAHADERAIRIVLDALTALGLLTKTGDQSGLDPLVETMLVKDSPAYAGAFTRVTLNPRLWGAIGRLGEIVRTGQVPEAMVAVPAHEFWVEVSEASEGISQIGANAVADQLVLDPARPAELLDVAVGSGVIGFYGPRAFLRAAVSLPLAGH